MHHHPSSPPWQEAHVLTNLADPAPSAADKARAHSPLLAAPSKSRNPRSCQNSLELVVCEKTKRKPKEGREGWVLLSSPGAGSWPSEASGWRLSFCDSLCPGFFCFFLSSSSFFFFFFFSFTVSTWLIKSNGSASSSRRYLFATAQPKASGSMLACFFFYDWGGNKLKRSSKSSTRAHRCQILRQRNKPLATTENELRTSPRCPQTSNKRAQRRVDTFKLFARAEREETARPHELINRPLADQYSVRALGSSPSVTAGGLFSA